MFHNRSTSSNAYSLFIIRACKDDLPGMKMLRFLMEFRVFPPSFYLIQSSNWDKVFKNGLRTYFHQTKNEITESPERSVLYIFCHRNPTVPIKVMLLTLTI